GSGRWRGDRLGPGRQPPVHLLGEREHVGVPVLGDGARVGDPVGLQRGGHLHRVHGPAEPGPQPLDQLPDRLLGDPRQPHRRYGARHGLNGNPGDLPHPLGHAATPLPPPAPAPPAPAPAGATPLRSPASAPAAPANPTPASAPAPASASASAWAWAT